MRELPIYISIYISNWTYTSTLDMAMKIGSFGGKATDFNRIFLKEQVI